MKGQDMDSKKTIKDICEQMNISIKQLAEKAGIDPGHLKRVSTGRAKMTAKDLLQIALTANISIHEIETGKEEQNR